MSVASAQPIFLGPRAFVPEGERVIMSIRPDPASIVLIPLWPLAGLGIAALAAAWVVARWPEWSPAWATAGRVWAAAAIAALAIIGWQVIARAARRYILTDRRIVRVEGVFRQTVIDAPLERVQHVALTRLFRERVAGLGTLGFATAGTAWVEARWVMIDRPRERMEVVRAAIDAARIRSGGP